MFDALSSPLAFLGAVVGLVVAQVVHWMVPSSVDVTGLAAWLVGIGFISGLGWDLMQKKK